MNSPSPQSKSTGRSSAFLIAIILLGQAIARGVAGFSPVVLVLIGLAIVGVAIGICCNLPDVPPIVPLVLMAIAVAGGLGRLGLQSLFFNDPRSRPMYAPFLSLAVLAAIFAAITLFARRRTLVLAAFWILVAIHFLMGLIAVTVRVPLIDVYTIQSLGC